MASQYPELDALSKELLLEAAADPQGHVLRMASPMQTYEVKSNGKSWSCNNDPRYEADLEAALATLVAGGLLSDARQPGEVYKVTQKGYRMADAAKGI